MRKRSLAPTTRPEARVPSNRSDDPAAAVVRRKLRRVEDGMMIPLKKGGGGEGTAGSGIRDTSVASVEAHVTNYLWQRAQDEQVVRAAQIAVTLSTHRKLSQGPTPMDAEAFR